MRKNKDSALNGPMADIQTACGELALAKNKLQTLLAQIQNEQLAVTRKYSDQLRTGVGLCTLVKGRLLSLVSQARALFIKPKSRSFDGITVGFEKDRDSVQLPSEEMLVRRIREVFPLKAALLIHQPPAKVNRDVLKTLSRDDLKLLGVSWTNGADNPIVRIEKSDVEAQAQALLDAFEPKPATQKEAA